MDYSKIIYELRQRLCLTQNEMANLLGVGITSVSRWEQGHFEPTMQIKKKIKQIIEENDLSEKELGNSNNSSDARNEKTSKSKGVSPRTYISLFSSAGVGCFGFKKAGFQCVATNELLERRLNIQRINKKCKYEHGYIGGDITQVENQKLILNEIEFWKKNENVTKIDVLMATPPCQGMSSANYKKGDEIDRNSLVVEAIHLVKTIQPRIFVFENVRAFLTTMCIDKDNEALVISDCIDKNLSQDYNIFRRVVNFSEFGIPSSRPRTLVIGTLKTESNFSPLNIFPLRSKTVTLREAIGDLRSLEYGDRDPDDLYHSFRTYPKYMQDWIHDLKEGETAFNNSPDKVPYKLVNGEKQTLKSGFMGNKFCRMCWDKPAPCITTRNDQLASQSTIHPVDDRVLSIRELMRVMSIPEDFKWTLGENAEDIDNAETLIRQSIGEAVPTGIILQIANNINKMLDYDEFIKNYNSSTTYADSDNFYINAFLYEKKLADVNETGSFYTPQIVVYNTIKDYVPKSENQKILEPAVGMGAFIPQFLRLIDTCKKVDIDLVDISYECLSLLKKALTKYSTNKAVKFNYINDDFLTHNFSGKYDCIITNPPYFKMNALLKKKYSDYSFLNTDNIYCLFMHKYSLLSDEIMCVIPKTFIMIPDANEIRLEYQNSYYVSSIYDYGVKLFKEVFIEILSISFSKTKTETTYVENRSFNIFRHLKHGYIFHDKMWLIYRDEWFDEYIKKLKLDCFDFFRDRQLTNKYLKNSGKIWVLRSKNLLDDGTFVHKSGYDKYVDSLDGFQLSKYYGKENYVFINFTYNTRGAVLPKNCTVNGSFCILLPKQKDLKINLSLYATEDFRRYYAIVKNLSKFTINVDSNSIYYIGVENYD